MSQETLKWLNNNILVGFTDKRGKAWHYKAEAQGDEPNHYTGPIPIDDVRRRLFCWNAVPLDVKIDVPCSIEESTGLSDTGEPVHTLTVPHKAAWARDDTWDVLGIFTDGYEGHQYDEWLLDNVARLINESDASGLAIGSAGLLKGGGQAFVQIELPENITTKEGVVYRPNLLAGTSFDGSLATTYKKVVTVVVCDNTLTSGLSEHGQQFKAKHTRNSPLRIRDAQEALAIVDTTAEKFSAEVERLCEWKVTPVQWEKLLKSVVAIDGTDLSKRAKTIATKKYDVLDDLYSGDQRCAPWKGTAFGALQAWNTYNHQYSAVRGQARSERNMSEVLTGGFGQSDDEFLTQLALVTASVAA